MKSTIFGLGLALGLSAGLVGAALAEPSISPAQEQVAAVPSPANTAQKAFDAFQENVNPSVVVPTTGPYDQEDQFVNPKGFPLGGYKEIGNPPQ